MTRSSMKELCMPFKDTEQEFRSSRKHFKKLSLDKSRSPNFDLFLDQEEYSEEEVMETMAKTIEQYMSKTRANYGLGVARPKIEDKDNFELKGQFLKDLQMQEVVFFYNRLDVPTRQILDSRGAISSKTVADTKVPTTPKITHLRKKGKLLKKLPTLNLVHLFKEGDIEQLLWDSTKGTMQTLQTKNEANPWKKP
ncbi:hypothetical protein Tco_0228894 [Tanacetum coccineum]